MQVCQDLRYANTDGVLKSPHEWSQMYADKSQPSCSSRQVRVVASLPCYSSKNVNEQRGGGVFDRSIKGLRMLNAAGYGQPGSPLQLDLVYNPNGAFLAPPQADLQACPLFPPAQH